MSVGNENSAASGLIMRCAMTLSEGFTASSLGRIIAQGISAPQSKCLVWRQLSQDDNRVALTYTQGCEVRHSVCNRLQLNALQKEQLAVLDEQHLIADVTCKRGAQLAIGVLGLGQLIDEEVQRHLDDEGNIILAGDTPFEPDRWQTFGKLSCVGQLRGRSEEHTSELQSLMRISYAVFCLKKKTT